MNSANARHGRHKMAAVKVAGVRWSLPPPPLRGQRRPQLGVHYNDVCKKRVANIRDQFKKHRNKRKTKNGQGAVAIKKYKYEESLKFLLPHIQDRNTITSIESDNEETQNETVTSPVTTPDESINTDEQQQQEDRPPAITEPNFTPPADPNPNPPPTPQFNNSSRIVPQSQSSASSALMEYILKK
ncbi:unnamed protein product [Arctia plantaginis]|uniref:MADF domain-containing protein n=1 Tax=Arctia plantaginis TaxID=874455 RepID=A0A8S1A0C5_ARCPL|nr:unnamed protein product [Arctia plantaginis]